jgi:putative RecB family exonuclease
VSDEKVIPPGFVHAMPPYLSPSSMSTFRQCPLKFKFNKIDGIPDQPSSATLLGNFVHEILEDFYVLPNEERTIASVKSLASTVWHRSDWENRIRGYVRADEMLKFRWNAWWCLENLWKVENPQEVFPQGIESELNGPLGKATVKGFIDRYEGIEDGKVRISDYKTGKKPSKNYVDDKFIQLRIYAALLSKEVPNITELQLLYLKDGVNFTYQLTEESNEAIIQYVSESHEMVEEACRSGEFKYNKTRLCDWCAYKTICPGWKK